MPENKNLEAGRFDSGDLGEAVVDLLITEVRDAGPGGVNPQALVRKTDALLASGGAVFEAVAKRRLLAAPTDALLGGAVALLRSSQCYV